MTGLLRPNVGDLTPFYVTLSDTSATVVLSGRAGRILNELQVSNGTGGDVTITVDVHDGTNVLYEPEPGQSVAAGTTGKLDHDGIPLFDGQSLRVTGAANVSVWGTYINIAKRPNEGLANTARIGV